MSTKPLTPAPLPAPRLDPAKFRDPDVTAKGERRAVVALTRLRTLWFNTGSLCNITCHNCYMDSSPRNDRLAYMTAAEVRGFLDQAAAGAMAVEEIGFTGGEPFMNPDLPEMLGDCLGRGYRVLVLTNAMKPLHQKRSRLLDLRRAYGPALALRVSMDHYTEARHEEVRGDGTWRPMMDGLKWLVENGFNTSIAGRTLWHEADGDARAGYAAAFARHGIPVDAADPAALVLFPEMDAEVDVPEITIHCWDILGVAPETIMCASSRMVVKRKGADSPVVVPCTLLPYQPEFEMGPDLAAASRAVKLNHPHCAKFCVLGGASCSAG
ncbi:MAG: radical SAM protein [Hyphomicrobiales bacterium]|nr:radical SAM protein [Hyphomicrobiales bacterium]MCP5371886.1 radical SAM protein [Hyphomicrobiales bacterium]